MKIAGKNAWQLPISLACCFCAWVLEQVRPRGFADVLIVAGLQLIAFFCALNAVLAFRRHGVFIRVILFAWFIFMMILTPIVLLDIGSITSFGFK